MAKLHKIFCKNCRISIYRNRGRINENIKLGHNFYCSRECEGRYKTKREVLACENCGKRFIKTLKDISSHNYCSCSCAAKINNQKFPKRKAKIKICANPRCRSQAKGVAKYCSKDCRIIGRQRYAPEDLIRIIRLTAQDLKRVPAKRELKEIAELCVGSFGSWNNAIITAGFQPNRSHSQRMYKRVNTTAFDKHRCDSISEAVIDDWLTNHGVSHEKDTPYPRANYKADWRVGNVFIEYFGLAEDSPRYDRTVRKKREFCRRHNIQLIEIYARDLYPTVRLDEKMKIVLTEASL